MLMLWFAEKFVSLLIEQHRNILFRHDNLSCDLLKNSYLCLLNNTQLQENHQIRQVVICWKIRIFAYWTTPWNQKSSPSVELWFAEKFVSLLIEQHLTSHIRWCKNSCDLLKNSYLCLLNNTWKLVATILYAVVICWKIRIFAYWTTPRHWQRHRQGQLWFAEKFVSLLIEQHLTGNGYNGDLRCDLLKNSYLCLLNNTFLYHRLAKKIVVICWKIRIFAYWTTPNLLNNTKPLALWFAEKFVSLLIEQHP